MEVRLSGYELYGCSFCETGGGGHLAVVILVQVVHELHTTNCAAAIYLAGSLWWCDFKNITRHMHIRNYYCKPLNVTNIFLFSHYICKGINYWDATVGIRNMNN